MPRMTYRKQRKQNRRKPRRYGLRKRRVPEVFSFKRRVVLGNITSSCNASGVSTPAAYGASFQLSDLTSFTEFTTLFDQYKITGVKLDFIPFADNTTWQVANNGAGVSAPGGPLLITADHDDASPPASANEMLQKQTTKVVPVGRRHRMYIKPKFNLATYSGGGVAPVSGWLDNGSTSVPHYGVKAWMAGPNIPDTSFTYQVWATYYIKCKGVQ